MYTFMSAMRTESLVEQGNFSSILTYYKLEQKHNRHFSFACEKLDKKAQFIIVFAKDFEEASDRIVSIALVIRESY